MPMVPPELGICAFEGGVAVGFGFFDAGNQIDHISKSDAASMEDTIVEIAGLGNIVVLNSPVAVGLLALIVLRRVF